MATSATSLNVSDHAVVNAPVASALNAHAAWYRLGVAAAVLAVAAVAQGGMLWHLRSGGPLPMGELQKSLAEFPYVLGVWQGKKLEITDPNELIGNEHLKRSYVLENGQGSASLWMAYSRYGLDRGHHPEICYAVAGKPEMQDGREELVVEGHEQPIQRYRFGDERASQWVYYWTYTIPTPETGQSDFLRRIYYRLRSRPASITIEVFADQVAGQDPKMVEQFVRDVDRELQNFVGEKAVRSSTRTPVTVQDESQHQEHE